MDPHGATSDQRLPVGAVVIGCSLGCDVVINGKRVHPRHATIVADEGKLVVHRSGPGAEVRVNDTPVKSAVVKEGDVLAFGETRLRVERRREPALDEASPDPKAGRPPPARLPEPVLELLDELYQWTHIGSPDRHGALLGLVVDRLELHGAALLATSLEAPVALLHAWGEVITGLEQVWVGQALDEAARRASVVVKRREMDVVAVIPTAGGGALGLLVRGLREHCSEGTVTLILRFLARDLRAQSPLPADRSADSGLVFPEGVLVGRAPAMWPVYESLRSALGSSISVHFAGEVGVGKRALARVLDASTAPRRPATPRHLSAEAWPETFDMQLAALHRDLRRRRHAQPLPTVFISEVDRLTANQQAGLVALLDTLGELATRAAERMPRIVSSATRDLQQQVERGQFRRDLWLRLSGTSLRVPALRDRREDVPLFLDHFLAEEMGVGRPAVGVPALEALVSHEWPGNLWELRREAQRVALRVRGCVIDQSHLSLLPRRRERSS